MKGRSKREAGGRNLASEDLKTKNMEYTKDSNVNREAYERKHGGKVHGSAKMNMGRKPRKSGGRTGSNMNPLSSAAKGTNAPGRDTSGSLS